MGGCSGVVNLTDLLGQGNRITVTAAADTAEKYGLPKGQRQAFRTRPDGNKELFVTLTGNPGVDAEEIDFYLEHEKDASIIFYLLEAPKAGLDLSQTQGDRDFVSEFLQSVEASRSLRDLPDAVFNLPQVQALTPAERDEIDPYLPDACYTYLTDTGIMPDVMTGEVVISDLAHWIHKETGKTPADEIIERAKKQAAEAARGSLRSAGGRKVKMLEYPVDKVNNTVWNLLEENTHGQMVLNLKAEPNGAKHKKVDITYSINFDNIESDLPIVKRLTPFDKRVYIAVGALWSAGNDSVTIEEIARAMGYETEPNDQLRKKIDASMTKFHAVVTIDNRQEIAAGYKYPRSNIDGPLLPFYRGREYKNGQLTAVYVITLYVEGKRISKIPLIEFAAGRGQVTQLPRKVLQTPLNKTDENLRIEDYCIERITRYRREGKKILLSTLYSKCGITDRKHKERAPEKIERLFDYYKTCGEVKDYKLTKDAITFEV